MAENGYITLSELQQRIKAVLSDDFRAPVWIVAEIADLKENYASGHCYLELVEKGTANGVPKAQARAVIWRGTYGMLSSYFKGATGQELSSGMKVLVSVAVTYHELYGLSLQISDIDPLYTIGDMERQRQLTIEQLREDGVFDLNRELEFPTVPQRIAVISSPGAAGLRDFMKELEASGYRFSIKLFEAVMQGHGAEASIISALEGIAAEADEYDLLVIIRGGGSQSDLSFLNSYMLSFHIAQFPLPVVTGLGHDKDQSVLDMVSAVSLKTPTAVAGFLVQRAAWLDAELDSATERLHNITRQCMTAEKRRICTISEGISRIGRNMTHRLELRLGKLEGELIRSKEYYYITQNNLLSSAGSMLAERAGNVIRSAAARLDSMQSSASGRDPQAILSLGFSIVRAGGKVLRDPAETVAGQQVEITLQKGEVKAKIS